MDKPEPGEVDEDARVAEQAATGPAVAPDPPSASTVPVCEPEPSNPAREPQDASELVRRPDEVIPQDAQVVELAAERPNVVAEPTSVEITSLSELDPSSTALKPELASELARRADDVILEAAASESPMAQPANTASQLSEEALHDVNPAAAARALHPPDLEGGEPPEVCMRTFPATASSVTDARSFAAHALADTPTDVVDDIRLMVSELASNAIEHAIASFELSIQRSRQEIRVEVTDSGRGTPAMRTPQPDALTGRGLQIVNMVSTRWGVEQKSDSAKTVWFTLELAPPAGPTPPAHPKAHD